MHRSLLCASAILALSTVASAQERPWLDNAHPELLYQGGSVMDWFTSRLTQVKEWAEGHTKATDLSAVHPNRTLPDGFFRFAPVYVGTGQTGKTSSWESPCFRSMTIDVAPTAEGYTLTLDAADPATLLCADNYLIATVEGFKLLHVFRRGKHEVKWSFNANSTAADKTWVAREGFRVFRFMDSPLNCIGDLLRTVELFLPVIPLGKTGVEKISAEANLKFIKDYANVTMEPRPINNVDIDESYFNSGDFLGIIRLDGLDPIQVFGTGAHTGHTTILMRDEQGDLFVHESTDKTAYWPNPNIQKTPFKEWIELARAADFQVVHLPLSAEARAKFNTTAALEWFRHVEGMPYGYHNFLWGWIDTEEGNLPFPLGWQLLEVAFGLIQKYEPAIAVKMWGEAFNKRVGTQDVPTVELINAAVEKNITFGDLMSMPEKDSWVYSDGLSMVCDVFVCSMYKHGGLFGDMADEIQCTEMQNWDVETLAFFDTAPKRPQACIDADPELPMCQLMGKYRLRIPDYGTVKPYPRMRENCAALPPKFERKPGC
eukprot:Hpha_TRINITY_DN16649_c0_g12::TRINITY_DN16649_c0_g12_i1::g.182802::m.182802